MRTEIVKISVLFSVGNCSNQMYCLDTEKTMTVGRWEAGNCRFLQFYKNILCMFYENEGSAFTKKNVYDIISKNI